MSGGLTPCQQLRPSSRRGHVNASNSQTLMIKKNNKKNSQTFKLIIVCTAQLLSKTLKSLDCLKKVL